MLNLDQIEFWAKTTEDKGPGIGVFHHALNVGHVAHFIASHRPSFLADFKLNRQVAAIMAALHDIGKISQGFQCKCPAWLERNGLTQISTAQGWQNLEKDHSKVSQFTVQNLLFETGIKRKSAIYWAVSVGAHHGRLHRPTDRGLQATAGMSNDNNASTDAEWEKKRRQIAHQLIEALGELPDTEIGPDSPHLWWLAGLISVADWIGSDETNFPPEADQNFSPAESRERARKAVERIGFARPTTKAGFSFDQLFCFPPNDLQSKALEAITEPGVYVIEAPMGMGKTEAALACAYRLLTEGKANGIYFALPTQATSNRIHLRVNEFIGVICQKNPTTRLIHANSWLMDGIDQPEPSATAPGKSAEDARAARDWFASAKRAILAPFGVGTVDQALLSVVAAKHFFVRRFGLAGKVVILDEIHSYDFYTGTLIRVLCKTLEDLGCTVILLSATLTPERRAALLDESESSEKATAYPLISGRQSGGAFITPRPIEPPKDSSVHIDFMESKDARRAVWDKASQGACVLWICDTVASAQMIYAEFEILAQQDADAPALGLLHSRFPHFRREELEEYWMDALGKDGEAKGLRPSGCILVSTQVVEQSVDLDADLLVTELAPTDMLLQRIGRLWRHPRGPRPTERPECWILREAKPLAELRVLGKEEIRKTFGAKAWVYSPYVLLRSLEEWSSPSRSIIRIPMDIRALLKATYVERENEPEGWQAWKEEIQGDEFAKKQVAQMAANIWNPMLDDQEGVQTRVSEVKTILLILAVSLQGQQLTLLNGEVANLADDIFRLDTARALHRNLVKVPKSAFTVFQREETTRRYVKGEQAIAWVQPDGTIKIPGLKEDISLYWHIDRGVEIRRGKEGKIDHESCD